MTTDYDALDLPALADMLADVETSRTPLGWPTENAVQKASIERRILELVRDGQGVHLPRDPTAVPCEKKIRLRSGNREAIKAGVADLRTGGLFVRTDATFTLGEPVEVQIRTENDYPLRVSGHVDWVAHGTSGDAAGVCLTFAKQVGDSAERRLRRLIFELLKHRADR